MIGWLADLFRLAWGLLYWNVAKTRFRLGRGRTRCPCQSPSDSGRAFETTCEASLTWHRQERFRRVCPLLQRNAAGDLRCSVNTADVRPFWGRALLLYGGTAAMLYLCATLGYFALQRTIGVPVSYATIAYPPHWPRLDLARSQYFATRADRALLAGQIGDAEKSLTLAHTLDPSNYPAALKLALLHQHANPTLSDNIYERLLHEHPARRPVTATAWYQALILRGDYPTIIPLAVTALSVDPTHEAAWTHALLFALRHSPLEKLETLAASSELPAAPARSSSSSSSPAPARPTPPAVSCSKPRCRLLFLTTSASAASSLWGLPPTRATSCARLPVSAPATVPPFPWKRPPRSAGKTYWTQKSTASSPAHPAP